VFYLKLLFIAVAMLLLTRINRLAFAGRDRRGATAHAVPHAAAHSTAHSTALSTALSTEHSTAVLRRMAIVSLVCWAGAITAGRLLAYTYTRLHVQP
jgi:hypothetical protein